MAVRDKNAEGVAGLDPGEIEQRLADGWSLPAEFYADAAIHDLEQEWLLRRSWIVAGLEREVEGAGDFATTKVGGIPIVVVRDKDGVLRAYVNICRHRGHPVAAGRGTRGNFRCPYHAWTYDLKGSLVNVPRGRESDFEFSELSLIPAAVDIWAGVVFVSVNPTESLISALGELPQVMKDTGYAFPFEREPELNLFHHSQMHLECNWKIAWENSLECYHCPTVHAESLARYYKTGPEEYKIATYDRGFYQLVYFRDEIAERFGVDGRQPAVSFYYLFPGMTFTGGAESRGARMNRISALGPTTCMYDRYMYRSPDAPESDSEELHEASTRTLEEDRDICLAVQDSMRAGAVRFGRTMPRSEAAVRHFHRLIWSALVQAF